MRIKAWTWGIAALAACSFAWAQEDGPGSEKADDKPAKVQPQQQVDTSKLKPVAKVLAGLQTVNATPNYKAKYYIYLQSASWCGPCREELPKIAKLYPAMKKKKVEIILIGGDDSPEGVKKFLTTNKAEFPGVNIQHKPVHSLPGYKASPTWPHVIFVDDKGNVLHSGHGSDTMKWESIIKKKPQKKGKG